METLAHRDWLRLHEVVLDLHAAPTLADLPLRILAGLRRLFPYDAGSVQDDRGGAANIPWLRGGEILWQPAPLPEKGAEPAPRGLRVMAPWGPNFLPLREAFFAVSAERHPHTDYYRRTGDGGARRLSEVVSLHRLRRTRFYNEISRPIGVTSQLTIYAPLAGGAGTLTVAACRARADFSDRERLQLELLRPHVAAAWRRVLAESRRLAAPQALPSSGADCAAALRRLGLTGREAEVLAWVRQGKTNAEIGVILGISPLTAKLHVERVLAKLGCETRTAAARIALELLGGRAG